MQTIVTRIFGFLLLFSPLCAAEDWKLEKNESNVEVFSQKSESGYNRVRVVTEIESSPKALMNLLDDTEAAPNWIAHARKVETLKWFGDTERTVHSHFKAPWPLSDRDMVTFSKTTYLDDGGIKIDISDKGREHIVQSHYVRMRNVSGVWTATPLDSGMLRITYEGYGEASGNIPRWMANKLVVSSSHETFVKMRKMLVLPRYQPKN